MTVYDEIFRQAALPALLAMGGETIIYRPADRPPRPIRAIVHREPETPIAGLNTRAPSIIVECANHAVDGIPWDLLDVGSDRVDLAILDGGPLTTRAIASRIGGVSGVTAFMVR